MIPSAKAPRQVACPTCGKMTAWSPENPDRPFCSDRCKQIDLGAWANEEYRLPEAPPAEEDESGGLNPS